MPIRVLIADDNAEVLSVLAALVESDAELELAATAIDAAEAVELVAREQPDVALIDVRMPAGGGVAAAHGIATHSPRTRVVALTASDVPPLGLDPGEVGCIVKGSPVDHILRSIKEAADGRLPPWPSASSSHSSRSR